MLSEVNMSRWTHCVDNYLKLPWRHDPEFIPSFADDINHKSSGFGYTEDWWRGQGYRDVGIIEPLVKFMGSIISEDRVPADKVIVPAGNEFGSTPIVMRLQEHLLLLRNRQGVRQTDE